MRINKIICCFILSIIVVTLPSINASAYSNMPTVQDIELLINSKTQENSLYSPNKLTYQDIAKVEISEKEQTELRDGYREIINYSIRANIPLNMDFVTFVGGYKERPYKSVNEYIQVYYSLLAPMQNSGVQTQSSGSSKYYYNIGTTLPSTVTPNYSQYNLLSSVQKGDVIYEANGGFGITGHIAIVEGIFYNASRDITYIRIIEAIDIGVCRSLLDDTRVDEKDAYILRVVGATTAIKDRAVAFCIGEIGSSYSLDFKKDTSSSETDWYCSELVWAGYYNQGIDIERNPFLSEPGVTPRDIYNCDKVYKVGF